MVLHEKHCKPVEGGTKPLSGEKAAQCVQQLTGWELILIETHKIKKLFEFENFDKSMEFVNKIAKIAGEEDHHPDICINYNKVEIVLSTHKINGLHENDFILAAKIDNI